MKFKSRKDGLFALVIYGSGLLSLFILIKIGRAMGWGSALFILPLLFFLLIFGFVLWMFQGTHYELTKKEFKFKCGPSRGNIRIKQIREITQTSSIMSSGLKAATARKGLIIRYNDNDKIYISPKTNERFISAIRKRKRNIKIVKS